MRTLVDRHYADNWVVPWGLDCYTDLAVEWESFRAARAALLGAVSVTRAKDVAAATTALIPDYLSKIGTHISKAHLTVRPAHTQAFALDVGVSLCMWRCLWVLEQAPYHAQDNLSNFLRHG